MIGLETARLRARMLAEIRSFFARRSYLEVDTPLMAPALIPEPHIEVFETAIRSPYGEADGPGGQSDGSGELRYLIPSPELWMKELLCEGFGNIFQLSHCFRNAESTGPQHNPEFTMLEWYTVDAGYLDSADLVDALLDHLASEFSREGAAAEGLLAMRPPAIRMTVAEAFDRYADISPTAFEGADRLRAAAKAAGLTLRPEGEESYDDLFQRVFLTCVEEELPSDRPMILTDYPAAVPTLALQRPGSPFAERWSSTCAELKWQTATPRSATATG